MHAQGRFGGNLMQAIILCAGRGARLSQYSRRGPKCFLPLRPGLTVIERMLSQLESNNISKVIVVLGYQEEYGQKTVEKLGETFAGLEIRTVVNREYESTETLASLLVGYEALGELHDEIFIVEGDVICDDKIISLILEGTGNRLAIDFDAGLDSESMKCVVLDGTVSAIGKELDGRDADGEYLGLAVISGSEFSRLLPAAREFLSAHPLVYYEDFVNHLWRRGSEMKLSAIDVQDYQWIEFDYPDEYRQALKMFGEQG